MTRLFAWKIKEGEWHGSTAFCNSVLKVSTCPQNPSLDGVEDSNLGSLMNTMTMTMEAEELLEDFLCSMSDIPCRTVPEGREEADKGLSLTVSDGLIQEEFSGRS